MVFIGARFREQIQLADAAKVAGMSPNYFSSLFHKWVKMSFTDYMAKVRTMKAGKLLQESDMRINEVAFEVGFQSLSQFNRSFLKVKGMPPREFRRLFRDRNSPEEVHGLPLPSQYCNS